MPQKQPINLRLPGDKVTAREYKVFGIEHVYDAFDTYEHANSLPPVTLVASTVADALDRARQALQSDITESRRSGGFLSSGMFLAEVIRVVDADGYCIFQNSRALKSYFGGQLEDATSAWLDQRDIPFMSCFLSYNRHDEAFTRHIYDDLSKLGLRCWFAPNDLRADHLETALKHAIESTDRLLIVLSANSLASQWVAFEAKHALEKEQNAGTRLLFPVFLDASARSSDVAWVSDLRSRGYGVDFSKWQDSSAYGVALDSLVRDLTLHLMKASMVQQCREPSNPLLLRTGHQHRAIATVFVARRRTTRRSKREEGRVCHATQVFHLV